MKNKSIDSLICSSPRKSLVKGERFIRGIEEKPELHYDNVQQALNQIGQLAAANIPLAHN